MREKVREHLGRWKLVRPGERIAVAVSGGADSVALLRVLLELRSELGIVLSVAHFHHGIRGAEADEDRDFVAGLAKELGLEFLAASGDGPGHARARRLSLETAARELRHAWFNGLVRQGRVHKIATAHTLDDQAETVLLRILRGTGVRGLAGIALEQKERKLVRPLLAVTRQEVEAYLGALKQSWRDDSSNLDLQHTRNRVRHRLLPLLEREFNPAIRQTLAELADIARAEDDDWSRELAVLLPRLVREGKPARSGRSASGNKVLAIETTALQALSEATQRMVLQRTAEMLGVSPNFRHIEKLREMVERGGSRERLDLPGGLTVQRGLRELTFQVDAEEAAANYKYVLRVPGETEVPELSCTICARVISAEEPKVSGYNSGSLLSRTRLAPELTIRNWQAGDRFFPAHSRSPRKVKELLQPSRLGKGYSASDRKLWPVIESGGDIVWMRGFPVANAFAAQGGEAILIEERKADSDAK